MTRTPPPSGWRRLGGPSSATGRWSPEQLFFSTPEPAYQDKTNATTIHAALGLLPGAAYDMVGSVRSAVGALASAVGAAPT